MDRSEQMRWAFAAFLAVAVAGFVIDFAKDFPLLFGAIAALGSFR